MDLSAFNVIELFALRSADSPENPVMTAHGLHGGCIIAGIYMGSAYVYIISPSLISRTVSVDVKYIVQELCESHHSPLSLIHTHIYIKSLSPPPPPPPSLISLVVSVDVKHHVYLLTCQQPVMKDKPSFLVREVTWSTCPPPPPPFWSCGSMASLWQIVSSVKILHVEVSCSSKSFM